jgi:hypothetical protein
MYFRLARVVDGKYSKWVETSATLSSSVRKSANGQMTFSDDVGIGLERSCTVFEGASGTCLADCFTDNRLFYK